MAGTVPEVMADPQKQDAADFFSQPPRVETVAPSTDQPAPPPDVGAAEGLQDPSKFFLPDVSTRRPFSPDTVALSRQFMRDPAMERLEAEGVDVESGAGSFGQRADLALTPPERRHNALSRIFGEGSFRETGAGTVVTIEGKEFLLDERGFSTDDLADLIGAAPEIGTAMLAAGTAIALAPGMTAGVIGLGALAVITGVAGQVGGASWDVIQALRNGGIDMKFIGDMAKRRGIDAAVDSLLDFLSAGAFRVIGATKRTVQAPFGARMEDPIQREIGEAVRRRGVTVTPGTLTGSPSLLQAEAVGSKVPASREVFDRIDRNLVASLELDTRGLQKRDALGAPVSGVAVGTAISQELTNQRAVLDDALLHDRALAGRIIEADIRRFEETMSRRPLSASESGEMVRRTIMRARLRFKAKQTLFENQDNALIATLPLEDQVFGRTNIVGITARELIDQFPTKTIVETTESGLVLPRGAFKGRQTDVVPALTTVTTQKQIPEFFPSVVRNFLNAVSDLDKKISISELRKVRQVVNNSITQGEALPGLSTGMLRKLAGSLTAQIRDAIDNAPTSELRDSLARTQDHYRTENVKFRTRAVARAFREEGQPGFVDSDEILPNLILRNRHEDALRVLNVIGVNSIAAGAARRSAFREILHKAQSGILGDNLIDPKKLAAGIDKLTPESRAILFQGNQDGVGELTKLLAAKFGTVDISTISKVGSTNQPVFEMLRDVVSRELAVRRTFDTKVIKPILRGELGVSTMNPDDFVRFVLRDSSEADLKGLWRLLPENLKDDFQSQTISTMFEKAIGGITPVQDIRRVLTQEVPVGNNLLKVMAQDFGDNTAASLARIRFILGDETMRILRDIGTIQSARGQAQSVAKAAGGLVGGSIITQFADLKIGTGFKLWKFRILAKMMTSQPVRWWFTRPQSARNNRALVRQILPLVLPQITEAVAAELGDESEAARSVNAFFARALQPQGLQ